MNFRLTSPKFVQQCAQVVHSGQQPLVEQRQHVLIPENAILQEVQDGRFQRLGANWVQQALALGLDAINDVVGGGFQEEAVLFFGQAVGDQSAWADKDKPNFLKF